MGNSTFGVFDCTLVSQVISPGGVTANSGNVLITGPNSGTPVHVRYPYPPFVTITNLAVGQIAINITGIAQDDIRHDLNAVVTWIFKPNYVGTIPSIPSIAKIKKMTWRTPCSCSGNITTSGNIVAASGHLQMESALLRTITPTPSPAPLPGGALILDSKGTLTSNSITISGDYQGSNADWVIFDYTGTSTFLTLGTFLTKYESLKLVWQIYILAINSNSLVPATASLISNLTALWHVDVEYELAFTYQLASPPATQTISPGQPIIFTSDPLDPDAVIFTNIDDILITPIVNGVPGTPVSLPLLYWTDIEPNFLEFIIPEDFFPEWPEELEVSFEGVQFGGVAPIQRFTTIYFHNAPGIYTLVMGKAHDTYYDWDESPVTTLDTKIPDPTGRTGYF